MLTNRDGDITLRVNSRLDGYAHIFDLLYQRRSDLFEFSRQSPFSRGVLNSIVIPIIYSFFLIIFIAILVFSLFDKENGAGQIYYIVLGVSMISAMISWSRSPRSLAIDSNSLTVKYFRKIDMYSKDDIASISFWKGIVTIILKDERTVRLSASWFAQSPFVIYYVLKCWYPDSFVN